MPASSPSLSQRVARSVLTQTLRVRRGENVIIEAWSEALPWAVPFVLEARRLGAHPIMLYEDEEAFWETVRTGAAGSTGKVGDHEWAALDKANAYVFFFGPTEWTRYDDFPGRRTAGVSAYNSEWYRRAAKARIRGARMYIARTGAGPSEYYHVDQGRWRAALERASLASPQRMHRLGTRLGQQLRRGKRARLTHPNGTDVEFRLGRFPIQLDDALVDEADLRAGNNMTYIPGGVVGIAIDHTSGRGTVVGNHTVYPDSGPMSGIRWSFRDGRLVDRSAEEGEKGFEAAFSAAPKKGRDLLSYVSVGLNPDLSDCPLMEDQEAGAVVLRIGGNRFAGGKNRCPYGAWVAVNGGNLSIDGKTVLRGGRFV